MRDRRIERDGSACPASSCCRRRDERQRQRDVRRPVGSVTSLRPVAAAHDGCQRRPIALASSVRRQHLAVHAERDVAAGDLLQLRRRAHRRAGSPTLSVPRMSGCSSPMAIGTVTSCSMPSGCGSRLKLSRPSVASRTTGWLATTERRARRRADRGEHLPGLVGDEQQVRVQLVLIVAGDVLHRRRIVGVDGRLELRGASAMSRAIIVKVCGARRPQLLDERAGRVDLALQRGFRLRGSRGR